MGTSLPAGAEVLARQTLLARGVEVVQPRAAGPLAVLAHRLPSIGIQVLGTFQVLRNAVPVQRAEWQSKKARELLKIVVALRRPVPREQLMELLWPGVDPVRSGNRLSVLLSMVRDVLQIAQTTEAALVSDGSVVWLDQTLVSVDVEDFLGKAAVALDMHRHDDPNCIALLEAAVCAHTGDFLVADPYAEWAEPLAEEVRATHIAVLRALSARHFLAGEVDGAVRATLRLLGQDPYDEPAHLDLVAVLMGTGRLGEARRHYRNYVRRMNEIEVVPQSMPGRRFRRGPLSGQPAEVGVDAAARGRRRGSGIPRNGSS
jgi:DNA-binding SARP family transcriptional activator